MHFLHILCYVRYYCKFNIAPSQRISSWQSSRSKVIKSSSPCRLDSFKGFKSFRKVKLHCSVVLSSHIESLSSPNGKVTAGRRTVPQIKVTALNFFRDFCFKMKKKKKKKKKMPFLEIKSPKFRQFTNCHACQPSRWVSRFFGSRNTLHINGLTRDFDSFINPDDF